MGLWSIITGANKAGDAIDTGLGLVNSAAKGLDALVYTDEEAAQDTAANITKNMDHALAFAKMRQNESGASAVTRRIAMLIILGNFTMFTITGLVLVLFDKITTLTNLGQWASTMMIGQLSMTVVASLFGYYAWTKGKKK
jgi:hypothetical protein